MTDTGLDSAAVPLGRIVDAHPAPAPARIPLEGRHVRIVPFEVEAHAADLYALSHGDDREALWAYLGAAPFENLAAFTDYYAAAQAKADPLLFAILDKASGRAVGHATYMRIDRPNRVIEVGNILYTAALARTPGGTEAMYLMARHIFEELGYRRYEWKCNALNAPSRRAALRYGFTFEGIFRDHMIIKGHNRDTAWFSMLEGEWPQRALAFEAWLAPENFDAAGRQLTGLAAFNAPELSAGGLDLRRARAEDIPALVDLQQGAYARNRALLGVEPIPLQWDYTRVLRGNEVWVAGEADALEAALILAPRADDLLIESIAVAPGRQGSGLGNALLAAADARARALARPVLRLYTGERLEANLQWYRRRGFATERVEQRPDRRVVHMARPLAEG
ncbi:GNAT family N-acetyltransferase [Ancylobacter terrae]|uniref:GNAT family N-acetyltransferase n=1 Tax=Ancylobacter sp. sgz301288 TaxID=3342077 RepID=UPI003859264E